MRRQGQKIFLASFLIILLSILLISGNRRGVEFTAYFKDAKMLKKGDPLVQSGIQIGSVANITQVADGRVQIKMQLIKKHQRSTSRSSIAYIAPSPLKSSSQQVELYQMDASADPIVQGTRVEGIDSNLELQYRLAKAKLLPMVTRMASQLRVTAGKIQDYLRSPDGRHLTGETYDFLVQAKEWTSQEIKDFRKNHPEVEKSLQVQMEAAKHQGNYALLNLLQEIEKNLRDANSSSAEKS